ncbi:MAG: hypothetical protein FJ028_02050 [Chloroflexi bacterium]|nr:hypothetical protein [Chloroflexota bacterium]
MLRRQTGAGSFLELARSSAVTFTDAPAAGSYDYAARAVISTFRSADSPSPAPMCPHRLARWG